MDERASGAATRGSMDAAWPMRALLLVSLPLAIFVFFSPVAGGLRARRKGAANWLTGDTDAARGYSGVCVLLARAGMYSGWSWRGLWEQRELQFVASPAYQFYLLS